jgi:hypothetical protein
LRHAEEQLEAWLQITEATPELVGEYSAEIYSIWPILLVFGRIAFDDIHLEVAVFALLLARKERYMHEIGGFALGHIPTTVITGRRRHALMANHLLDCRQVGAGVEELGDVGAAHVVWCERGHASRRCLIVQDNRHPLIREPLADSFAANRSAKQRARIPATHLQPGIKRRYRAGRRIDSPVFVPLAGSDDDRAGLWLVIGYVERCDL